AIRQEVIAGWGHVLTHFFARVAVAALVRIGKAVVVRHAGARAAAFHHFGELFGRKLGRPQRQCVAAITLVARGIPFVAVLAYGLALEDFLAEFDEARFFGTAGLRERINGSEKREGHEGGHGRDAATFHYAVHLNSHLNRASLARISLMFINVIAG